MAPAASGRRTALRPAVGDRLVLREELLDRDPGQFDAEHAISPRGQPQHVQRLARERNEDPARPPGRMPASQYFEQWRHAVLVEADAASRQRCCQKSGSMRFLFHLVAAGFVDASYSTDSPSTFCRAAVVREHSC